MRIAPTIPSAEVFDDDDGPSTDNFLQYTIDAYETVRTDDVDKYEDDDYEDGDYDSDIYEGYNSDLFDDDDAVILFSSISRRFQRPLQRIVISRSQNVRFQDA